MKDKKKNCVELNIYVECDKCSDAGTSVSCEESEKHDNDESCVKINVFVECDKKHSYTI